MNLHTSLCITDTTWLEIWWQREGPPEFPFRLSTGRGTITWVIMGCRELVLWNANRGLKCRLKCRPIHGGIFLQTLAVARSSIAVQNVAAIAKWVPGYLGIAVVACDRGKVSNAFYIFRVVSYSYVREGMESHRFEMLGNVFPEKLVRPFSHAFFDVRWDTIAKRAHEGFPSHFPFVSP